ncbi:MAG: hypothetical protein AB7R89_19620 [Dehalococcoidia bacterium]
MPFVPNDESSPSFAAAAVAAVVAAADVAATDVAAADVAALAADVASLVVLVEPLGSLSSSPHDTSINATTTTML